MRWYVKQAYIVCSIVLCICFGVTNDGHIYANSTESMTNQNDIYQNDKITFTFSLDEDTSSNVVKGTLHYDDSVFEPVQASDFTMLNKWESFFFNPDTKEFIAIKQVDTKEKEVFSLSLQAKDHLVASTTSIKVSDVMTSNGTKDIENVSSEAFVQVVAPMQQPEKEEHVSQKEDVTQDHTSLQEGQTQDTVTNEQVEVSQSEISKQELHVDTSDQHKVLHYVFLVLLALLAMMGCVCYKFRKHPLYQKYVSKMLQYIYKRKVMLGCIVCLLCSLLFVFQIYASTQKGDIIQDGKLTHEDVVALEKHVISLMSLSKQQQEVADMNNDHALTVTDVALLMKRIQATTNYQVKLYSAMQTHHFEKHEDIVLTFQADVTQDERLQSVMINDTLYDVVYKEDKYEVVLPKEKDAGKKQYHMTKVVLDNGKEVPVDYTETIAILKDDVVFQNYQIDEQENSVQMQFEIVDVDHAFLQGSLQLINKETNKIEDSKEVSTGQQTFNFQLKEDVAYTAYFTIAYQRNDDEVSDENGQYQKTISIEKELSLSLDASCSIEHIQLYNQNFEQVDSIQKHEPFYIGFQVDSKYAPSYLKNKEDTYPMIHKDAMYYVAFDGYDTANKYTLQFDEIVLENGKSCILDTSIDVQVEKEKARVERLEVEEDETKLSIDVGVYDGDQTISNVRLVVKGDDQQVLLTKVLDTLTYQTTMELPQEIQEAYTIQVVADVKDTQQNDVVLYEKIKQANPRVQIQEVLLDQTRVEKGDRVNFTISLHTNQKDDATAVVVNNQIVPLIKQSQGYQGVYQVQQEAGMQELHIGAVHFHDVKVKTSYQQQVEVLKTAPTIENMTQTDQYLDKKVQVQFSILDKDAAFVSGKVVVKDAQQEIVDEQAITSIDTHVYTFAMQPKQVYTLEIYLSYNRDEQDAIQVKDTLVYTKQIQLLNAYEVTIHEAQTQTTTNTASVYFKKQEPIQIQLSASSASVYTIDTVMVNQQEYHVEHKGNDTYVMTMDGFDQAGVQSLQITDVRLSNGMLVNLEQAYTLDIDILKDAPIIRNVVSQESQDASLHVSFEIVDEDHAITQVTTKVLDSQQTVVASSNSQGLVTLDVPLTSSDTYMLQVQATYDRSSKSLSTSYPIEKDKILYEDILYVQKDAIALKDTTFITLYTTKDGVSKKVDTINESIAQDDVQSYYVKIESSSQPTLYSHVKAFQVVNQQLQVELAQEDLMQRLEDGSKTYAYTISFPLQKEGCIQIKDKIISSYAHYQEDKKTLYENLQKLMPFKDNAYIIQMGNQMQQDTYLATKTIQYIVAMDQTQTPILYLTKDRAQDLSMIRIVYEDGTKEDQEVTYTNTLGNLVAVYEGNHQFSYQFHDFLVTIPQAWLDTIVQSDTYDFESIQSLTPEQETRIYKDYYMEQVQPNIKDIFTKVVATQGYPTYFQDEVVKKEWQSIFENKEGMYKILYAYMYYDKWYHISYEQTLLSQLLFYQGEMFSKELTMSYLIDQLLTQDSTLRSSKETHTFYQKVLQPYLRKDLMEFVGGLSTSISNYTIENDWFSKEFDGVLVEKNLNPATIEVAYRAWDILKLLTQFQKMVLPILTAPQEDLYMMSVPSQLFIGSMNAYSEYGSSNGRDAMKQKIEEAANRLANFYGTTAALIPDAQSILNSFANIAIDTRQAFAINIPSKQIVAGVQEIGISQDPVIKWIYEASGVYPPVDDYAAAANGSLVYWTGARQLDHQYFGALTHETAHNQDGKYFYNGYGRRSNSGAESHADGMWTQSTSDGNMVFNFVYEVDPTQDLVKNFSYERINTPEKFYTYQKEMFETGYVLDYLAAQAFLSLTPREQSKVAAQVSESTGTSTTTTYQRLTATQMTNLNLKTMEDLWDHKIVWTKMNVSKPVQVPSASSGQYAASSFYDMMWYQPHNDKGTPDNTSFKRLAQEMAGVNGYVDGYLAYASNYVKEKTGKTPTDLEVLRFITNDDTMTYRTYKLQRYEHVKQNLDKITYFDPQQVIEAFKKAFQEDTTGVSNNTPKVEEVKRLYYGIVKRATNDFSTGNIYQEQQVISITNAQQLIDALQNETMGYYRLENDIDFSGIRAVDGTYINATFMGVLDGNNHSLKNVQYTLCKDMQYASIKNLTIDTPVYVVNSGAYLANSARNVSLDHVTIQRSNAKFELFSNIKDAYEETNVQVSVETNEISSIDDLLAIQSSDIALTKQYKLTQDIDVSAYQTTASSLLSHSFKGELDGNGYVIKGLHTSLFESIQGAYIHHLTFENSTISNANVKAILTNKAVQSTIENVKVKQATFSYGTQEMSNVAGLIGEMQGGNLKRISIEDVHISANGSIGGVVAKASDVTMMDVYVQAELVTTKEDKNQTALVGGVVLSAVRTNVSNIYANVLMQQPTNNLPNSMGGIIAGPSSSDVMISNAITTSDGTNGYRITSNADIFCLDVYELNTSKLLTNTSSSVIGLVHEITKEKLQDSNFYTSLGWSQDDWNFDAVHTTGIPVLK